MQIRKKGCARRDVWVQNVRFDLLGRSFLRLTIADPVEGGCILKTDEKHAIRVVSGVDNPGLSFRSARCASAGETEAGRYGSLDARSQNCDPGRLRRGAAFGCDCAL